MIKLIGFSVIIFWSVFGMSQIRVKTSIQDLGDILEENGTVFAHFELENPYYSDTIKITDFFTSCGCTAILTRETVISPRQKLDLKVSYDPTDRIGLFAKTIHLKTLTGKSEKNNIYLKLTGNVIGKKNTKIDKPIELLDYKIAPLYFFPITTFDTSYFDLNKVIDFANDITYEIDYYSFTTLGFEIRIRDKSLIEDLEILASYVKSKFIRAMKSRNYLGPQITFIDPIFIYDSRIPLWSAAKIKVYSVKYNNDKIDESIVKLTSLEKPIEDLFLINYSKNKMPLTEDLLKKLNTSTIDTKLFKNGKLVLNAKVFVPENKSIGKAKKIAKKFKKGLYKQLKKSSGISKKDLILTFDTLAKQKGVKYSFSLYDNADIEKQNNIKYIVKPENIVVPLLPTYKAQMFTARENIDMNSEKFKQFWDALIAYSTTGKNVQITVESSSSKYPKKPFIDPFVAAKEKGEKTALFIKQKYYKETGRRLTVRTVNTVQGPDFETKNFTQPQYFKYEYIKLVPNYLSKRNIKITPIKPKPYIVNYDFYYIGIDTSSLVFKKFAEYLIYEIQKNGFVEIRTESSASHLLVDKRRSNEYWAYSHLEVSKKRLFAYLKKRLIDPNRVIITNEKIVVQGIPYKRKTPVVRYRSFQYVTFVPSKYL